jgi:predicted small secreted protein
MKRGKICGFLLGFGILAGCATVQQTGNDMKEVGANIKQDFSKAGPAMKEDFKSIGPAMKEGFTEMGHDMKNSAGKAKESVKETFR